MVLMDKERNILNKYGELFLLDLTVLEETPDPVLVPPAKVEVDEGEDSHDNVKDIDGADHGHVLGSVLVVSGKETVDFPTA
jgi:hypothetical protein